MRYVYKKKYLKAFFYVLDFLGSIIFFIPKLFRKRAPSSFNKIAVLRLDHIGDVISATGVLRFLRKAFPEATIDFIVPSWASGLVKSDPYADNVIIFDPPWFDRSLSESSLSLKGLLSLKDLLKKSSYDLAIDLRGDARDILAIFLAGIKTRVGYGITGLGFLLTHQVSRDESLHEVDKNIALLKPLGIERQEVDIELYYAKENIKETHLLAKREEINSPYAVFHTSSGHPGKNWDPSSFAKVAEHVREEKNLIPVFVGSKENKENITEIMKMIKGGAVDLSGKTTLATLGSLLKGSSLFIGLDSGPSHIAAASKVPTVIIFSGMNNPAQWAPRGKNVHIVYPGKGESLTSLKPEKVFKAIDVVFKGEK